MSNTPPLLTGRKLEKSFASRLLFRDLSFGVHEGARIGLVGANGAGKSTLLKLIAGLITPDSGEVVRKRGLRLAIVGQVYFEEGAEREKTVQELIDETLEKEGMDAHSAEVSKRVDRVLSELKLQTEVSRKILELSGGWQRRVQLACALILQPDLLLLDEPTNHLDTESIIWLEEFLRAKEMAYVVVSHDRLFLTRVVDTIYEMDARHPNGILVVDGSFETYLERKAELIAGLNEREKRLANRLRRETEWLRRGAKARQTKQRARMEEAEVLADEVGRMKALNTKRRLEIDFEKTARSPEKLIEAKNLESPLWGQLNLTIHSKSRIGLMGSNGCGKTTLIRTLLETQEAILQRGKKVVLAPDLSVRYFEQSRDTIAKDKTVGANLSDSDSVVYQGRAVHTKSYLSKFGFRPDQVDLPAGRLSGGERARLRIAQILLEPAMLLVLDEPTNDLDFETLEVLEEALEEYDGAILLVSHDRAFLDRVTDEIYAFGMTPDKSLVRFASYLQWENAWRKLQRDEISDGKSVANEPNSRGTETKSSPSKGRVSYKDKFEFENMEAKIKEKETLLARLESELSSNRSPNSESGSPSHLYVEIAALQIEIDALYSRWAELETIVKSSSD